MLIAYWSQSQRATSRRQALAGFGLALSDLVDNDEEAETVPAVQHPTLVPTSRNRPVWHCPYR